MNNKQQITAKQLNDIDNTIVALELFAQNLQDAADSLRISLEGINLYQISCDIPLTYNANYSLDAIKSNINETLATTQMLVRDLTWSIPNTPTSNKIPPKKETK